MFTLNAESSAIVRAAAIVLALALPSAAALAQAQQRGQPGANQPGAHVYRSAPQTARPTQGRPERGRVPNGYRTPPDGRGYYPPAMRPHGPPQPAVMMPPWYRPYWDHPYDWWHPRGWYGSTNIWWRDGWWFEVAIIGQNFWEWGFNGADMPFGYGQPPLAITCTYQDPNSGRSVELTIIGYSCPPPIDVQVPDDSSGG